MPEIAMSATSLSYRETDAADWQCLLDFTDYYANLGALPLLDRDKRHVTITTLLRNCLAEYPPLAAQTGQPGTWEAALLPAVFLLKQTMLGYRPRQILELGCGQGLLTWFLTKTAVAAHPKNQVFTLSEVLYGPEFVQTIQNLGDALQNLSLLTTPPETGFLPADYFDFTLINGPCLLNGGGETVQNALRVTKSGGTLLCLVPDITHPLCGGFTAALGNCKTYPLPGCILLYKIVDKADKTALEQRFTHDPLETTKCHFYTLWALAAPILGNLGAFSRPELDTAVQTLSEMEDIAIELFALTKDLDLKNKLNIAKENLLDFIYSPDAAHRARCLETLRCFTEGISADGLFFSQ